MFWNAVEAKEEGGHPGSSWIQRVREIELFVCSTLLLSRKTPNGCRTPKSLLAGLMWLGVKEGRYSLRHTCEESDKLSKYAWVRHDGANYGRQVCYQIHKTSCWLTQSTTSMP